MNRLDFSLPNFFRMQWANDESRKIWEPRIAKISSAWQEIELAKGAAIQFISIDNLIDYAKKLSKMGKIAFPVAKSGISSSGYVSKSEPVKNNQFEYRVAAISPEDIHKWANAKDDREIGELLGYPQCCIDFFDKYWNQDKYIDLTWPMVIDTPSNEVILQDVLPENNILLRWLGVRPVSHLPCSFYCAATREIAKDNIEAAGFGFKEEMKWMMELLSIPVNWSAIHGIGEVKTSLFRFCFNTDATGDKYSVSIVSDKKIDLEKGKDIWTDNGFSSLLAMDKAHYEINNFISSAIKDDDEVIDLGCGNGQLLLSLMQHKSIIPNGVDLSPIKISACRARMPKGEFHTMSIFSNYYWRKNYDLALLMPGRLNENSNPHLLIENLHSHVKRILLYTYDGTDPALYFKHFYDWTLVKSSPTMCLLERN